VSVANELFVRPASKKVSEVSGNGSDSSDTIPPIHPAKFAVTDTSETFGASQAKIGCIAKRIISPASCMAKRGGLNHHIEPHFADLMQKVRQMMLF
jgi:hypothetical protein